jgi:Protein of unknown function (DUF3224)
MKKSLMSIPLAAIASVGLLAGPVAASPVTHGDGTYQVTGVAVHSSSQIGSYTIVKQTLSIDNEGVLTGPSTADVTCAFAPTGEGGCAGVEHFTGTIGGRTGTATFAVGLTVDAAGFHGTFVALSAGGGLTGLRGTGSFEGGPTGTNSFDYSFK